MIAEIVGFFAVWQLGFWILTILASIAFIAVCENDLLPLGIIVTIVLAVIYHTSLATLLANPTILALGVVGWVVAGITYSIFSWQFHINKEKKRNNGRLAEIRHSLRLSKNKSRITNWIIFWPWGLFWNLTGNLFSNVFEAMSGVYQKMVDRALAPLEAEEKLREEKERLEREERQKREEQERKEELAKRKLNHPYGNY